MYDQVKFPYLDGRPFTFLVMVSTLDGKIITGNRDEPVMDLGSPLDHAVMRQLESKADAVLIGAGTLRATPNIRYDDRLRKLVVTTRSAVREGFEAVHPLSLPDAFGELKRQGVHVLCVEGGATVNATLLRLGLIDEIFLTLAPKIKLGDHVPTLAGGEPFARHEVQKWKLVSCEVHEDEIFLRYRRP